MPTPPHLWKLRKKEQKNNAGADKAFSNGHVKDRTTFTDEGQTPPGVKSMSRPWLVEGPTFSSRGAVTPSTLSPDIVPGRMRKKLFWARNPGPVPFVEPVPKRVSLQQISDEAMQNLLFCKNLHTS